MDRDTIALIMLAIASISSVVGIAGLIVSVLVLRHGTGQATQEFNDKIELALSRFEAKFEEAINRRLEVFVDSKSLSYQMDLLKASTASEFKRLDYFDAQVDHRVTRNSQIMASVLDVILRLRMDEDTRRELQAAQAEHARRSPSGI